MMYSEFLEICLTHKRQIKSYVFLPMSFIDHSQNVFKHLKQIAWYQLRLSFTTILSQKKIWF